MFGLQKSACQADYYLLSGHDLEVSMIVQLFGTNWRGHVQTHTFTAAGRFYRNHFLSGLCTSDTNIVFLLCGNTANPVILSPLIIQYKRKYNQPEADCNKNLKVLS